MEKKKEYGMEIPEEARRMRILVVDPDTASLMHTTSMLEQANYKVTSTTIPNVALSMIQEQGNQYDLVMAAVQMRGMDCISFLGLAKKVSNIPIALMSYKEDLQIAIRTLQRGACQHFVKPISQNDIQCLWQFTARKEWNKSANIEVTVNNSTAREIQKGKGKEVMVETEDVHKNLQRELIIVNSDDGKETENKSGKRKVSEDGNIQQKKKGRKIEKKRVKWNAELHAKFMNVLMTESAKGNAGARMQASDVLEVTNLPQAFTSQNSKEQINHHPIDISRAVERSKQQVHISDNAGNLVQTREANLRLQSQNITRVSPVSMASSGGLTTANLGGLSSAGRGEYVNHMPFGIGGVNLGTATQTREANLRLQSQNITRVSSVSMASSGGLTNANLGGLSSAGREEYVNHMPLGIGGVNLGTATQTGEANLRLQSQNITRVSPASMPSTGGLTIANLGGLSSEERREYVTHRPLSIGGVNLGTGTQTRESNLRLQSQNITRVSPISMASSRGLTIANLGGLSSAGRGEYVTHMPLGIGGVNLGTGTQTKTRFGVGEATLTERVDQIRHAYKINCEGKTSVVWKTHDSIGNQTQAMDYSSQSRNEAMRIEKIENMMMSGTKRNRSQYENPNKRLADNSSELVSGQAVMFGGKTMLDNYGKIGSNTRSMNFGLHPLPQLNPNPIAVQSSVNYAPWGSTKMTLPNPTYYAGQFSYPSLENYAPMFKQNAPQTEPIRLAKTPNHSVSSTVSNGLLASRKLPLESPNPNIDFIQNDCNWKMEPNELFQALNYPLWDTNNDGLFGSSEMLKSSGGSNQELDVMHGMPSEAGFVDETEKLTSDLGGQNLAPKGFANIPSSEGFLTRAQASDSQQAPIDDDASLDEFFAEMRPLFVDDEIRNSISNINNVM